MTQLKDLELYLPYGDVDVFLEKVAIQAIRVREANTHNVDLNRIADAIISEEIEKAQAARDAESSIVFDDDVVAIDDLGEMELMDITVSRDNLFYANGILTKNSMGIPATADLMLSISRTEQLDELGQVLVKQLKNRYGNKACNLRFVLGVDLDRQTLYDVNQDEQKDLLQIPSSSSIAAGNQAGKTVTSTGAFKSKFSQLKI